MNGGESKPGKLATRLVSFLLVLYIYLHDYQNHIAIIEPDFKGLGRPELLVNYEQFRGADGRQTSAEGSIRQVWFMADLLTVAVNNLATLSGKQLYLMRQNAVSSDLSQEEQSKLWRHPDRVRDHLLASSSSSKPMAAAETPTTKPLAKPKMEKIDPLLRWMVRLVQDESRYETPNFPLDQQPSSDPVRVTHIDVDLRNCTGDIRAQGQCGACYAFSMLALVEWHHCRQTGGPPEDFSEQFMLDCGNRVHLNGCVEGKLPDAKEFVHHLGLFKEQDYPYRAKKGTCKAQLGPINVDVPGWDRIQVNRSQWERVLQEQPILVEAQMPRDILSYSRGIHPGHNCDESIGHGMLIVGHGRQDGHPYWLLRNSMGKRWGENGYLRLSREADMKQCFSNAFVAKFRFRHLKEEQFDELYDSIHYKPTILPKTVVDEKGTNLVSQFLGPRSSRK